MPTRILITVIAVMLILMSFGVTNAQIPFIAVYFDRTYTEGLPPGEACPGEGVPGTLFIYLMNAGAWVAAAEFAVEYPPQIEWLADNDTPPVTIGRTPTGISMGFGTQQNGFDPAGVFLCSVLFSWTCHNCDLTNGPIVVLPHPVTGFLGYVDWPNFQKHAVYGLSALVCATIPVEESTWGKVKSLYSE